MKLPGWIKNHRGYTMMELVIVIIIIGILAAIAIPTAGNFTTNAKIKATEKEMQELVKAIVGDPDANILGYLSDIGTLPADFTALYAQGGASPYNPFTRTGWNGPYIDLSMCDADKDGTSGGVHASGVIEYDILFDAWDQPYVYDSGAKTITSSGPTGDSGDDIVVEISE